MVRDCEERVRIWRKSWREGGEVREGLCQRSSTPHWHQALQTRSAGGMELFGKRRRIASTISWGRLEAGIRGWGWV